MSITNTLNQIAKNSNGKMIVEKVPASKQPSAETLHKIEAEIGAMIKENDKVTYNSMHPNNKKQPKFSLNRENSNKLAKAATAIVFAAGLSLLNPMKVNAIENNQIQQKDFDIPIVVGTYISGLSIASVGIFLCAKKIRKNYQEDYNMILSDDNLEDDKECAMKDAIPYIKVICK